MTRTKKRPRLPHWILALNCAGCNLVMVSDSARSHREWAERHGYPVMATRIAGRPYCADCERKSAK